MQADVCIVGLGWLGQPLCDDLEKSGFSVIGTRTSDVAVTELRNAGVKAFWLNLNLEAQDNSWKKWMRAKTLVINIPPGRKDGNVENTYPAKINELLKMAEQSETEHIIFVSSISVYGSAMGMLQDDSPVQPETAVARALVTAEQLLQTNWNGEYAVVRLGGLYGPGRHPGRFFAGKENVPDGDSPVNFIHLTDAVGVIRHLIENPVRDAVLNACAPARPPKKDFYHRAALEIGVEPPTFLSGGADGKIIQSTRLVGEGFVFQRSALEF